MVTIFCNPGSLTEYPVVYFRYKISSDNQTAINMLEKIPDEARLEINKFGWKYIFRKEKGEQFFDIVTDKEIDKPTILHKLYSFSDYSVDALLNSYIYAPHPAEFNDLFDCHEDMLDFDDEDFIRSFLKTFAPENFPEERIEKELKENFKWLSTFVRRNFKEFNYKRFGVVSMTGSPMSIVMWSYYTNHQGFFIEFDLTAFPFKFHGPFPINYQKEIQPISIKECGPALGMLMQTNLKFEDWKHENEWRLLFESSENMISPSFEILKNLGGKDRKFYYPIKAVRKIGFGNRFFEPHELRIIRDKELHVTLKEDPYNRKKMVNKRNLLDFIIANNLNFYINQKAGMWETKFAPTKITKLGDNNYCFYAL